MQNTDADLIRAKAVAARMVVAATGLGIDPGPFRLELARLAEPLAAYGVFWLDADFRRLGFRTFEVNPPPLPRPGRAIVELETGPHGLEHTLWVVGATRLEDDLAMIAANGVPPAIVDDLGGKLRALGTTESFALGNRENQWFVTTSIPPGSVQPIYTLAETIGVAPYQVAMLGQLHTTLEVNGCTVTIACTPDGIPPELAIAYRNVPWPTAITVTNQLRRTDPSRGYGIFAGAFQAETASYLELTFRADALARVRVAFEYESEVVS